MNGLKYLFTDQTNGRPRERQLISAFAHCTIDAHALRRDALDAGHPLARGGDVHLTYLDAEGADCEATVAIVATPARFYGHRWWLICPACLSRRTKLYVARTGPACRACLHLRHSR